MQVSAEQAGWESIAPTIHEIYEDLLSEALLLMDPFNAFNSIKRNAFLHNISIIRPPLERYVGICYYANTRLFIIGGGEVQSMEGEAQGDPTIMAIYPIAIMLHVPILLAEINHTAPASADDLTAAGTTIHLRNWWRTLSRLGPKFGFFPEESKSRLTVKKKVVHDAHPIKLLQESATSRCS